MGSATIEPRSAHPPNRAAQSLANHVRALASNSDFPDLRANISASTPCLLFSKPTSQNRVASSLSRPASGS